MAHVEPVEQTQRTFLLGDSQTQTSVAATVPIAAADSPDKDYNIKVLAQNKVATIQYQSASLSSAGVNFAVADTAKNTFVQGVNFVLGKKVGTETYLYSEERGWLPFDQSLDSANLADYKSFSSGNTYALGSTQTSPLQLNTTNFDFNKNRDTKINQALIQIMGLGQNAKYFLYPINLPSNYASAKKALNFYAFRTNGFSPDGDPLSQSSLSQAQQPSYTLNSQIPGYSAGQNEYNIFSVTPASPTNSTSLFLVILPLALVALVMLGTGYLLTRF